MFRYPCSYLIYSEPWEGMPAEVREQAYKRLWEVLTGSGGDPTFAHLNQADRRAILEILIATKKDLPAYWKLPS
jgi:hypothetical protein